MIIGELLQIAVAIVENNGKEIKVLQQLIQHRMSR